MCMSAVLVKTLLPIDPAKKWEGRKCDMEYLRWSWCPAQAGEDGM